MAASITSLNIRCGKLAAPRTVLLPAVSQGSEIFCFTDSEGFDTLTVDYEDAGQQEGVSRLGLCGCVAMATQQAGSLLQMSACYLSFIDAFHAFDG